MLKHEEEQIRKFRKLGYSCYALAKVLGINYGAVKSYCHRNQIQPLAEPKTTAENRQLAACEYCGRVFVRKMPHAKFCSDSCRFKAWQETQEYGCHLEQQASEEYFASQNHTAEDSSKDAAPNANYHPPETSASSDKALALSGQKSDEWKDHRKEDK